MRRRLLNATLLAVLFVPAVHAATLRLSTDVVPVAERVTLRLDPASDAYSGTASIDLDAKKAAPTFDFHAEDMQLTSVKVDGADAKFESRPQSIVLVTPAAGLNAGRHTAIVEFTNKYNRQAVGLYKMTKDGEPFLFTQFEAIDARRAFPCWDEPSFKVPYELTVVIPKTHDAVSNTPEASRNDEGEQRTIRFAQTRPLPSYLIALAVGHFDFTPVPGTSIPTRIVAPKGMGALTKLATETTPPVVAALEKYFGQPYPFEKLDLIAVPEFWAGAMENPGAVTFKDSILLVDSATAGPAQKGSLARVTAHELAHMWFGDLVTLAWWDDLWLNESFADWMGDKITQQVYPELGVDIAEMGAIEQVKTVDARATTAPIRKPGTGPEQAMSNIGVTYDKGKAVLAMIEHWVGPDTFRAGVLDYLKAHAWGNATQSDFFAALAAKAGRPARDAMESFVDQPGIPLVTAEIKGGEVRFAQSRFSAGSKVTPELWRIPISMRYSDGKQTLTRTFLLDAQSKLVNLGKVAWVYPDADAVGYYRWRLPSAAMSELAALAPKVLTPKERFAFVGNANALFRSGAIHGDDYLRLISEFGNDPDLQVITSVASAVAQIQSTFDSPETRGAFASYVRRTLGPALERVGMTRRTGEEPSVTMIRPMLIRLLADQGQDPKVMAFAHEQAAKYLADPASVDPSIVNVVIALNALNGDEALFNEYRSRFEAAKTPAERQRFLGALPAFRDPKIRNEVREYALSGPLRPNEMIMATAIGSNTAEGRDESFRFFTSHFDAIASRLPRPYLAFMPMMASGCEKERVDEARKFFADEKHRVEGTDKQLAQVAEQVDECVALRSREMSAVQSYLRQ